MNKRQCFRARIPLSGSVLLSALQSRPPLWFSNAISDLHYNESRRETFVRARLFFQPEWKECGRNWFPFLCAAVRLGAGRKRGMCMKPTPFLRSFTHTEQRVRFILLGAGMHPERARTPRAPSLAPNQPSDLFQPCNSPQWALSCSPPSPVTTLDTPRESLEKKFCVPSHIACSTKITKKVVPTIHNNMN